MKKYALIAMLIILVAACKKKGTTPTPTPTPTPSPTLTISGINDVKLEKTVIDSASLNLNIAYSDSTHDTVDLLISGLPSGITVSPSTFLSGIPNFNTKLSFYDTSTTIGISAGTYPITIYCNSSLFPQKTFTFNLTIVQTPSLTTNMLGVYKNSTVQIGLGVDNIWYSFTDSIYADPAVPNRIHFRNYMRSGKTVYADVTADSIPNNYDINVPTQIVDQVSMYGSNGYYRNDSIYMDGGGMPIFYEADGTSDIYYHEAYMIR